MTNWKTTLVGIIVAVANLFGSGVYTNGGAINWKAFLTSAGIAALGLVAKDHDVTGGTREQAPQ